MYQVIIVWDEERKKSFYQSYSESDDTTLGNISCNDLPPYQDINKARSCYWNEEEEKWLFDSGKYDEYLKELEEKKKQEQDKIEESLVMTNAELTEAVLELAEMIGGLQL